MDKTIKVVGVGPGAKEYVTYAAIKAIEEAEVLVAGERTLSEWANPKQTLLPIKSNLVEVVNFIKEAKAKKKVAVLASGDPGMYGILNFLLKHFTRAEIEVIPGLSSLQVAAARIKTSWHDAAILSVHGRALEAIVETVRNSSKAFILTDPKINPAEVAKFLIERGISKRAIVCSDLSYSQEEVKSFTLEELALEATYKGCVLYLEDIGLASN